MKLTVKKVKSTMIGSDEFPMFTQDDLGKFKVNASVGDNYGDLRKLNV